MVVKLEKGNNLRIHSSTTAFETVRKYVNNDNETWKHETIESFIRIKTLL